MMRYVTAFVVAFALAFGLWTLTVQAHPSRGLAVMDSSCCLGGRLGVNLNSTADQTITMKSDRYVIRHITLGNGSRSMTLAVGGIYTAASKGGTPVVAATQVYTLLTGGTKFLDLTLAAIVATDVRTESTLYFSLTTAQGSAATADLLIYGDDLAP